MRRCAAIFMYLLLMCSAATAQQPFVKDYWLNESGTAVKVNTMQQDDYGYLWIGADDGLYKFNGRDIIRLQDTTRKAVTALAVYHNHVYIGYKDGELAQVYNGAIVPLPVRGAKPSATISDMYADENGKLWISTEGQGFYLVFNGIGLHCNTANGLSDDFAYNINVLSGRHILVSTDQGINEVSLQAGKPLIHTITSADGLPDNIVRVIKPSPDNAVCWAGTQSGGIGFYNARTRQAWQPLCDSTWIWGQVNDILPLRNGKAWVATDDGYLLEVLTADYKTIRIRSYLLAGKKIKRLHMGRSGVLWCATNMGFTLVTDEYMMYLPIAAPYKLDQLNAMVCDSADNIWFSLDAKLYTLSLRKPAAAPMLRFTAPASIKSLYVDNRGAIWVGTLGKGLYRLSAAGKAKHVGSIPSLENETVLDISGYRNTLWVSGLNGVEQLTQAAMPDAEPVLEKIYNKSNGAGSDYVYHIYPDSKGRIWMATDGGGVTMYDGTFKQYGAAEGLHSNVAYTIAEDAQGNIWASTLNDGLYWFDGVKWRRMGPQYGVSDINIATIAANATGQVIVVHKSGMDIWYPQSKQFRSYNKRQGIEIDSTSQVLKLFAKDSKGNVYIPFNKGFIAVKNVHSGFDIRPNITIRSLSVFFKPIDWGVRSFSYDQNHISFEYEGINFANPDKLHYRYKLDGYNDSWIITNDESVTFPQLSPGTYTFRVQASVNNVFAGAHEASYSFTISLPFWRRLWFVLTAFFVVIALVSYFVNRREKNLRKFSSLQRERMMFEYEHLKSQVNPHFLFNSLNTLASLIEEDKEAAADYTTHLSDLYRNMLSHRHKDLVTLEEEWEILENYLYIQKSRFGDALILETNVSDELKRSKRIVPLALQLLVENAIKHNVVSKSRPLVISITANEESITIRNNVNPKISKEKGEGLGMVNISNRYSLLTNKNIYYGMSDKEYVVNLPLL